MNNLFEKQHIDKRAKLMLILTFLAVLATIVGIAVAYYTSEFSTSDGFGLTEFYFTSDCLTEEGAVHMVYEDSVKIHLYNNDGLNWTDDNNIRYDISATNGGILEPAADYKQYSFDTRYAQIQSDGIGTHTYTLTPSDDTDATRRITVTATSNAGYIKTLSATFVFVGETGYYNITDYDSYVVLDIYTGFDPPKKGKQQVTFNYLVGDSSNPLMRSWLRTTDSIATISTKTVDIDLKPFSHYELIFFKRDYSYSAEHVNNEPLVSPITINGALQAS